MVILLDDRPLVYCLPGRDRVVVTTGALNRLNRAQLQAVLAHEQAHLSARHHLVIMLARILPDAFPGLPGSWPSRPTRSAAWPKWPPTIPPPGITGCRSPVPC